MSIKKAAISGIKWSSFSFLVRRILAFISNIIYARLLSPDDFGLIAMASLALGFAELFKDLGTGSAIIQRKEVSENLLSSVFWVNLGFGLAVSTALYFLSPAIAAFYRQPTVTPLIQVLSFSFFVSSLSIVQSALLSRTMSFERQAKYELISAIFSTGAAVYAAWAGFGVMSLVYQPVLNSILMLALLWGSSTWRPKWIFLWTEVREVAGYSLNLTAHNVLVYFARNADNLLIGRYLGSQDLGYYDLAYRLMLYPLQGISAVVTKVMFPLYSKMQDDHARFSGTYLTVIGAIALISFPLMLGLFAVSHTFVMTLFGEQWQPVASLLMIFAPIGAAQSIQTTVATIFQAKGRTDLMLRWGVVFSLVLTLSFVIGLNWGMMGMAVAYAIAYSIFIFIPSFVVAGRLIDLRLRDVAKTLWRPLLCSTLMCGLVITAETASDYWLPAAAWPQNMMLPLLVLLGAITYLALNVLINRKHFFSVASILVGKS